MKEILATLLSNKLFIALIVAFISVPVTISLLSLLKHLKGWRIPLICLIHSIFLVVTMESGLGSISNYSSEEQEAVNTLFRAKKILMGNQFREFVADNFVFLNTLYSHSLVGTEYGNPGDTKVTVDRKQLTQAFFFLHENHELVDGIICDLVFPDSTPEDSSLRQSILRLIEDDNKILLAKSAIQNCEDLTFRDEFTGSVDFELSSGKVFLHSIFEEQGISLPYKTYQLFRMTDIQDVIGPFALEKEKDRRSLCYDQLPIDLSDVNEYELYFGKNENSMNQDSIQITIENIGMLSQEYGPQILKQLLKARKRGGKKNLIFIGELPSRNEDVQGKDIHQTVNGHFFGSSILLGSIYQLNCGAHHFQWQAIILTLLVLVVILSYIIWKRLVSILHPKKNHVDYTGVVGFNLYWKYLVHVVKENSILLLVLIFFLLLYSFYSHFQGITILVIYIVVYDQLLKSYARFVS